MRSPRCGWSSPTGSTTPRRSRRPLFSSAYRAHEMLSGQIADAMVRQINAIGSRPGHRRAAGAGHPDRRQLRQLPVQRDPLEHRRSSTAARCASTPAACRSSRASPTETTPTTTPATGTRTAPRRARSTTSTARSTASPWCPACWTPPGRPFEAEGLNMPWYSAFGNHDGLVQGNFPQNAPAQPALHRRAEAELAARRPLPRRAAEQPPVRGPGPAAPVAGADSRRPSGLPGRQPAAAHPQAGRRAALHGGRRTVRPRVHRREPHQGHGVLLLRPGRLPVHRDGHGQPQRLLRRLHRPRPVRVARARC